MASCGRPLPQAAARAGSAAALLLWAWCAGRAGACDLIILNATRGGFSGPMLSRALEGGDFHWASSYELVARPRGSKLMLYPPPFAAAVRESCPDCEAETTAELSFVGVEVGWGGFEVDTGFSADGMNEAGLSVSMLKLGRSQFQALSEASGKTVVWMLCLTNYILGKFSKAHDVAEAVLNKLLVFASDIGTADYQHFSVVDRDGASIVIEYMAGQVNVYPNDVGVMTNDPGFPFHVENVNAHPYFTSTFKQATEGIEVNTSLLPGLESIPNGLINHGWNLGGLPGDYSPPSRFLRDFFLKQVALYVKPPESRDEWLALGTGLLNSAFITMGTAGEARGAVSVDHSVWGSLRLAREGIYAVRTYWDLQWKFVNLTALLPFDRVVRRQFIQRAVPMVDITSQFAQQPGPASFANLRTVRARATGSWATAAAGGDAASLLQTPGDATSMLQLSGLPEDGLNEL